MNSVELIQNRFRRENFVIAMLNFLVIILHISLYFYVNFGYDVSRTAWGTHPLMERYVLLDCREMFWRSKLD